MTNDTTGNATAPQAHGGGYEFDAAQEVVVGELAGAMRFVGTASIVLAVIMWIIGIATMFMANPAGLAQIIQGVILVFVGAWTRTGAKWFQLVVDTKGNDIGNLMNALGELRRLYNLQKWMMILALVLMVGAFVLGIVAALVLAGQHHAP